jgi:hypothetical protein
VISLEDVDGHRMVIGVVQTTKIVRWLVMAGRAARRVLPIYADSGIGALHRNSYVDMTSRIMADGGAVWAVSCAAEGAVGVNPTTQFTISNQRTTVGREVIEGAPKSAASTRPPKPHPG